MPSKIAQSALVVGAQGTLGSFIAKGLAHAGWQVTRAGRRPETAADFRRVDLADPGSIEGAVRNAELVVNTAHHPDLTLEETILRRGGKLIELIELSQRERAVLGRVSDPEGLVVTDTGLGGIAYLAVAQLLRDFPHADTAEYALMVSASGSSGRPGGLFAHGLLTSSGHHPTAKVPFPKPFGSRRCLEVGQNADGIPRIAVRGTPIRHFMCIEPRPLHATLLGLNAARLISLVPRASFTAGTRKVPEELSDEPICEWVGVSRNCERLATRTVEGRGYYRMTAAATEIFADALSDCADERARTTGVRSIEELLTLAELLPRLRRNEISVDKPTINGG
jgi:hypothetical protein